MLRMHTQSVGKGETYLSYIFENYCPLSNYYLATKVTEQKCQGTKNTDATEFTQESH